MTKIGIYGGSFNPVHNGHLRVAKEAIAQLELDLLIVVVAAVSPFKVQDPCYERFDRLLLLRLAFNGMDKVVIDDRELRRGGVSYTIDTVEEIAAEHPDAELVFIVGEDSIAGLPRWKDWDKLQTMCAFKSFPRTSESSTEIRRRLTAGESIEDLVPRSVERFIAREVGYNSEHGIVEAVHAGLARKNGYCPCRVAKSKEFFCPCEEFMGQLEDPQFHGLCHCRLYSKP
jgi:nicotinate-nucleotide adenylyltransferase